MSVAVRTHSVASRHPVARRASDIADAAARLVTGNAGRLPHVELIVTDHAGMHRLAEQAERRVARGGQRLYPVNARYGRAVLAPRGVLITINADVHVDLRELDATLVHELVHAAQLNRSGARARHTAYLRNNYGIEEVTDAEARKANRQIRADEDEAKRAEQWARHLT